MKKKVPKDSLKQFLSVKNETPTSADLFFYGDIVSDWGGAWNETDQYPEAIREFLKGCDGKDLNIYINSAGGSVFAGIAIYNMLSRHKGFKTVHVDGMAASIASVIALAGDRVIVPSNAFLMIHKPWAECVGNADDCRKMADDLDAVETGILNVYKEHLAEGADKGIFLHLTNKNLPDKCRKKRKYRKVKEKRPPRGESIENRPAEVDTREIFGHWEMDTVKGKKKKSKNNMLVLTERKTRQEIQIKMPDGTMASVVRALDMLERKCGDLFPLIFKSVTVDNGSEFYDVKGMTRSCLREGERTRFYFCHPYSSYERGSNEKQNRMIRRFIPKGTDFDDMTDEEVEKITVWLNNYPRGIFDYHTSQYLFDKEIKAILERSQNINK